MNYFTLTLNQLLVFFIITLCGYFISKKGLLPDSADKTLSRLLAQVMLPALVFKTMSGNLHIDTLSSKWQFLVCGVGANIFSLVVAVVISRFFTSDRYIRYIYTYSFTVANLGYFGYSLIGAVFGDAVLADMMIFTIPFNIFIYSVAFPLLSGHEKINFKSLLNPVCISLLAGIIVGLLNIPMPIFITKVASSLGDCMGPVSMLLTGVVIAQFDLKKLFLNLRVLIASLLRLIVIPSVIVLIIKAIGFSGNMIIVALGTTAMPLGLNTIVFPAACGKDTLTGASMALISNILCMLTIPIMFLIFAK